MLACAQSSFELVVVRQRFPVRPSGCEHVVCDFGFVARQRVVLAFPDEDRHGHVLDHLGSPRDGAAAGPPVVRAVRVVRPQTLVDEPARAGGFGRVGCDGEEDVIEFSVNS